MSLARVDSYFPTPDIFVFGLLPALLFGVSLTQAWNFDGSWMAVSFMFLLLALFFYPIVGIFIIEGILVVRGTFTHARKRQLARDLCSTGPALFCFCALFGPVINQLFLVPFQLFFWPGTGLTVGLIGFLSLEYRLYQEHQQRRPKESSDDLD